MEYFKSGEKIRKKNKLIKKKVLKKKIKKNQYKKIKIKAKDNINEKKCFLKTKYILCILISLLICLCMVV